MNEQTIHKTKKTKTSAARLPDVHLKFVFEFLRDVEGWEYRRGKGLQTWIYCRKGTASNAEVGVDIFHSQAEVGQGREGVGV